MRAGNWTMTSACWTAALAVMAVATPALSEDEGEISKEVRVKVVKCHDGDCVEMMDGLSADEDVELLVGDELADKVVIRRVRCDGEDCEEPEGNQKMVFVGGHGDVEVLTGEDGHAWFMHHAGLGAGGYLGVGLTELTPELREHFGVPASAGVMVSKVMDDSPAFESGVEVGDIITSVDGDSIGGGSALAKRIGAHTDGDEVVLGVWRDGVEKSITATVGERSDRIRVGDLRHLGGGHGIHKIMVQCDSEDEDCRSDLDIAGLDDFDCGDSEECKVEVKCKDGSCTCSINGEDADCAGIPGIPGR